MRKRPLRLPRLTGSPLTGRDSLRATPALGCPLAPWDRWRARRASGPVVPVVPAAFCLLDDHLADHPRVWRARVGVRARGVERDRPGFASSDIACVPGPFAVGRG